MPDDLACRIRMCVATKLAEVGAYDKAEGLLTHPHGTRISPPELDLLARIYVKQERLSEARVCWQEAASAAPTDPEFPKALAALSEHQQGLMLRHRIMMSLYAFMALIGLAAVLLLLLVPKLA
jgi:hypothetical protein